MFLFQVAKFLICKEERPISKHISRWCQRHVKACFCLRNVWAMSLYTSQHWSPITLGCLHFQIEKISFHTRRWQTWWETVEMRMSKVDVQRHSASALCSWFSFLLEWSSSISSGPTKACLQFGFTDLKAETCSVIQAVQYWDAPN